MAPIDAATRAALDAIDTDGLVRFLCKLIAIPSLDGEERPAQEAVAEWLTANGLEVDAWDIDLAELEKHPQYSCEVPRNEALGVVGWFGAPARQSTSPGRDLMLNGHIDVVPAGDAAVWTTPPFTPDVRDGRVYGRGAVDMKGGLCCALYALKALRDAGLHLGGRVSVTSVVSEEDGGVGTLGTLVRGHTADGAVILEPSGLDINPAQQGTLMFRLHVPGLAAHGCAREEGVNPIDKFYPLLVAIRELEARRCGLTGTQGVAGDPHGPLYARYRLPWPIEIGTLRAGEWPSSVPSDLTAEGRYGVAVGESLAEAGEQLISTVAAVAERDPWLRHHPPTVEWWGGRFESACTPLDAPIVGVSREAVADITGREPRIEGVTYGSDLRLLVNEGRIPTVIFGPGDVRVAHMADEHVPIADLELATQTLVLIARRFCGLS